MAIQPIDLQVLYTQLENVSKTVAAQQQGAQLTSAIQQDEHGKRLAEKSTIVQKTSETEEEVAIIKDHQDAKNTPSFAGEKEQHTDEQPEPQKPAFEYVSDPELGHHIDVSG